MNIKKKYDWAADHRRHAKELREQAAELLRRADTAEERAKEIEAEEAL